MKIITSRVLRMIESTSKPERRLEQLMTHPHQAESAYFVRLYDTIKAPDGSIIEGNLELSVNQLERDDIPSPDEDYRVILLDEYRRRMSRGETFYMFILSGYAYTDEFEDEMDPSKPEYEVLGEDLDGWMTIDEVCRIRDIDKSTVTRAIYGRDLICGLSAEDGRRYIKRDALFHKWLPDRKRSYLRDRRLIILFGVLLAEYVYTVDELFYRVELIERSRFGDNHIPEEGIGEFLEQTVPNCPRSLISWRARIHDICLDFGLDSPKKLHRGLGEQKAA